MWQSGKSMNSAATLTGLNTGAPVPGCVVLGKSFNFSVFQFLHTPSVGNTIRS